MSKWRRPRSSREIAQRNGTITLEKINQVSWNETEHIKIPQNQCTDKVTDVTVAMQGTISPDSNDAQKVSDKETQKSEFGLDFRYSERAYFRFVNDTETKAHSEKSLNVSDVHVSHEDGYLSRNMTIRAKKNDETQVRQQDRERANLDARFPRLASKFEFQPFFGTIH